MVQLPQLVWSVPIKMALQWLLPVGVAPHLLTKLSPPQVAAAWDHLSKPVTGRAGPTGGMVWWQE